MNRRERDRVEALERRRGHLVERLENWNPAADPSRTQHELRSLDWALAVIEAADSTGVLETVRVEEQIDRGISASMRGTAGS